MNIEEKLSQLLNTNSKALDVTRSYYQHLDSSGLAPEDLSKEFKAYRQQGTFCGICQPSLIMIPSPTCYEKSKSFYPGYFQREHNVRAIYAAEYPFEGIRGAYFPFRTENQHIDIVEMDNPSYFARLNNTNQIAFMKRFFDALKAEGIKHVGLSSPSDDRNHISSCVEAYVSFVSRKQPRYELVIDKILRVH